MRNGIDRRKALEALAAAAATAAGLSACGGGGGGGDATPAPPAPAPAPAPPPPAQQSQFSGSWTAAMQDATETVPGRAPFPAQTLDNQTLRQVVRLSLGGDTLRIKLSNRFSQAPVTFSAVRVARSPAGDATIDPTTDRAVTFSGQASVTLAPGAEVTSDAVALPTTALSNVAISMYFAGPTTLGTVHADGRQTAHIVAGNRVSDVTIQAPAQDQREAYYALTAVETFSSEATKVVVAFGNSLTDGLGSTMNAARRYPNRLDDRLKDAGAPRTGVVNGGISGNRWLHDFVGPNGSSRFERDVLQVAGVTHTIILLGISDIIFSVEPTPTQEASAQQLIDAIAAAVNQAHARGIKVLLGTLMPFKGAGAFTSEGEIKRQAVNAWIRGNQAVHGVVDFDLAMRSTADPEVLNPLYDSGDHVHPNDAGYAAMAAAVDLAKL